MNDNTTEKQVIILHPCRFTRLGIRHLLPQTYRLFDTGDLDQCKRLLLDGGQTKMVVISLQGERYSMVDALNLTEALCHYDAHCQVLVLLDTQQAPGLRNYLVRNGRPVKVIDPNSALPELHRQLELMEHRTELPVSQDVTSLAGGSLASLSVRELRVLEALLTGKSARQIASQLSLNEKTLSYYKCRALTKLGMKTVQSLLIGPYPSLISMLDQR